MWLSVTAGFWGILATGGPAVAQLSERVAPSRAYHAAFAEFYEGEYKTALDRFLSESRSSIKTSQSRWIDSICYETMCGECYYHMGLYEKALRHYTSALELYLAFPNWLVQVQFPATIRPDPGVRKPVPWAGGRRPQAALGQYPTTMMIGQGQIDVNAQIQRGGPVERATLYPIEPAEIVRCTTLAIRRRAQILGPLAPHDPVFENLVTALSRRPGPPNHWSEAWINIEFGLALAAAGREGQAVPLLQRGVIAAGEFLHPLTSTAQLELGRLAAVRGDYVVASQHFEEASCAAFYYFDPGVLEESFRYAALVHLMANRKGVMAALGPAMQWSRSGGNRLRQLQVSLLLATAENNLTLGQTPQANSLLEEARLVIGRRQMGFGRIGARRNFLCATALFQQRKVAEGDALLADVLKFMRQSSLWLFQISLADNFYTAGKDSVSAARTAVDLYQVVLRDPQPMDWAADPMEALAVMTTPHASIYEHWFEMVMARKEHEAAIEVADRVRRHRFLASLPLGGRLETIRWVLEGPKEMLSQQAMLQRQDLLTRYPEYEEMRQRVEQIRKGLASLPLASEDAETLRKQTQGLTLLANFGHRQEAVLREMAVRREPAELAFPPLRTTGDIQKSLPKGHAMLIFLTTSRAMYGFLLNSERYTDWQVTTSAQGIGRQAAAMLREMGQYQQNHELTLKDLAEGKWRSAARDLLDALLKGSRADFSTKFDELAIVPDGVLWYVPFETLQLQTDGQLQPLISRFRIRYAPTAALAAAPGGWGRRRGNTGVVVGRLFPKADEDALQATTSQIAKQLPGCSIIKAPLPAPSPVYATLLDRLIVLDDLTMTSEMGAFGWSPLPLDRGKSTGSLSDWLMLPWGKPEEIILPGFHTAAEESLKRVSRAAPGSEVFLSVCGLMAGGTRTVLLSRWRSGGQTSLDLIKEFTQELPHTTPADAWQRAVLVVVSSPLNLDNEPRIKRPATDESPRANHPFFWAGYMLVDGGAGVVSSEPAQLAAPAKIEKPKPPLEKPDVFEKPNRKPGRERPGEGRPQS